MTPSTNGRIRHQEEMKGTSSHELSVPLPASDIWSVYGTLELAKLTPKLLPTFVASANLLEGDGGVGTVYQVNFPPGTPGPPYHKVKLIKIDNEKRMKEAQIIEGGYLTLGFTSFLVRFEIFEDGGASSVIKISIEYEIGEDNKANAAFATTAPFEAMAEAVAKYLMEKKASS